MRWLALFLSLLGCDIFLKTYTYCCIPKMSWLYSKFPYGGIGIFKNFFGISFSLNHVENTGAAFGFFAEYSKLLILVRFLLAGVLFCSFFFVKEKNKRFPLFLIFTGAVGNLLDFGFYGHVIDMFYFRFGEYSYPVFNFADILVTTGIGLLFIASYRGKSCKLKSSP